VTCIDHINARSTPGKPGLNVWLVMNKMDRKHRLIPAILTIIIIAALINYLVQNRSAFSSLVDLNPLYFIIIAATHILFILVLAILNKIVLQRLDPKISTLEIIYLQFVNNILNKIILKGGPAFRAVHLKRRHNLSYSKFLAAFAGVIVINLAAQSFLGLLGMYLIYLQTGLYNTVVILSFVAVMLGSLSIMIIQPKISSPQNRILREITKVVEGWQIVSRNPKDVFFFVIISIIALFMQSLNTYFVFYGINSPIGYSESLILSSLASNLAYLNITPDGLGVREGAYLYTNSILSISEPILILGSLVQRAITFITSALIGGISFLILIKKPNEINENPV
jgi:uncharacterized protein (TIRG00374 family)